MTDGHEISNPENYKILIQIKKSRKQKRKTKYLNSNYDFIEDINQAMILPDMQTAENILQKVSRLSTNESRPRIIVKYVLPIIQKN